MSTPGCSPLVIRFDAFEVDLRAGELYKAGRKIKLQVLPFQALALLLERPGEVITREEFERRPDRDALVDELIQRTLGQVYAKMSRDLSASRLVVDETQRRASAAGIGFSIHTTHTTPEGATTVAGTHVFPFGEPYAITLMVVERVAGATSTEVETRRRLLDSLRVNAP